MKTIRYQRARLTFFMALCAILIPFGAWMYENSGGKAAFAGAVLFCVGIAGVIAMGRFLLDNRVMAFDRRGVTCFSILGEKTITWDELESVEIETVSGSRHLKFKGPFGTITAPRVSERLLGGGRTLDDVLVAMEMAEQGLGSAGRQAPVAAAPMPASQVELPRHTGFGRKGL